jgi:hypothetical protein
MRLLRLPLTRDQNGKVSLKPKPRPRTTNHWLTLIPALTVHGHWGLMLQTSLQPHEDHHHQPNVQYHDQSQEKQQSAV